MTMIAAAILAILPIAGTISVHMAAPEVPAQATGLYRYDYR